MLQQGVFPVITKVIPVRLCPVSCHHRAALIALCLSLPQEFFQHAGCNEFPGKDVDLPCIGLFIRLKREDEIVMAGKGRDEQSRQGIYERRFFVFLAFFWLCHVGEWSIAGNNDS